MLDEAFNRLRNRVFDIGGAETNRLHRYLEDWTVKQNDQKLDWVEFGPRLEEGRRGKMTDNLLDKTEFTEMEVSEGMNQTATGEKRVTISGLGDVILKYPT